MSNQLQLVVLSTIVLVVTITCAQTAVAVDNLPESFYSRPGLEQMPRIDYEDMPVVNVRDLGARGDGQQIVNAIFSRAVEQLDERGGGIIYIPKGEYVFEHDEDDEDYYTNAWGKRWLGSIWPARKHPEMRNIHFVGEGIESVLRFRFPRQNNAYYMHAGAFHFLKAENCSVRDLSITQSPFSRQRRGGDVKLGNSIKGDGCRDFQIINVHVDQGGGLGIGFFHSDNVWMVDCDIRNTQADNIKVDDCDNVTVAYSYFEEPMDDNISMIYYKRHRDTPSRGYYFLHNTVLGPAFGRGYIMCGEDIVVENNWIERCYGNGIATYGLSIDHTVSNNTLVRCGLASRRDNPRGAYGNPRYTASMKLVPATDMKVHRNRVFGAGASAFLWGIPDRSVEARDYSVVENRIEKSQNYAMDFSDPEKEVERVYEDLTFRDNMMVDNGASVRLGGNFKNLVAKGNRISQSMQIGRISGDVQVDARRSTIEGFEIDPTLEPEYRDIYAFARELTTFTKQQPFPLDQAEQALDATVINVRDHGAKGDGQTNDTAAFHKALDALPASGGTVYVPAGRYRLTPMEAYESFPVTAIGQHIRIADRANVHIRGAGRQSVLVFDSLEHQGIRFIGCEDVSVRNLQVTAARQVPLRRNRAFIDFSGCHRVIAQQVYGRGGNGPVIQLDTTNYGLVKDCYIYGAGQYGIRIEASCQVTVEGNTIRDTRDNAIHVGYSGSILRDSDYVLIRDNLIEGTEEGAGLCIISGKVEVVDNTVRDTHLSGIYTYEPAMGWAMNELIVRKNLFENCGQNPFHGGIIFSTPPRRGDRGQVLIEDNVFRNIPHHAIWVKFGRRMIWGSQGFKSFVTRDNTFVDVVGKNAWIDRRPRRDDGRDDNIRIETLIIEGTEVDLP